MVGGVTLVGVSLSSGELSAGSDLGEKLEFCVRRFWRLMCRVVVVPYSECGSWSN